jgi:hypothetical protein
MVELKQHPQMDIIKFQAGGVLVLLHEQTGLFARTVWTVCCAPMVAAPVARNTGLPFLAMRSMAQ